MEKNVILILNIALSMVCFAEKSVAIELWEPVLKENGILIEAKKVQSGVIPFRASTIIKSRLDSVFQVLTNLKDKSEWAPKLKEVRVHSEISRYEFVFSELYSTPWPAKDREFLLHGSVEWVSDDEVIIRARDAAGKAPADKSHVQAEVRRLDLSLFRLSEKETKVVFTFEGHLGGWIPLWLSNLIQKKWPYQFLLKLNERILTKKEAHQ